MQTLDLNKARRLAVVVEAVNTADLNRVFRDAAKHPDSTVVHFDDRTRSVRPLHEANIRDLPGEGVRVAGHESDGGKCDAAHRGSLP